MLPPYCQYLTIDYNTLHILVKSLLGAFPSLHTAAAFITAKLTSVHMVMAIIPAPISVSVVRWTVGAITVAAAIVRLLMKPPGHIDTDHRPKQSGKETGLFRGWAEIACRYVDFLQRLIFFNLLRFRFFLFTQIFRQRKMPLLA